MTAIATAAKPIATRNAMPGRYPLESPSSGIGCWLSA
jgi:hypothetical protein